MRNKLFQSVILIFLITSSAVYAQQAWNRISPVPQENTINDIAQVPGSGRLMAVGAGSTVMCSDDGGTNWTIMLNPAGMNNSYTGKGIRFIDETTGFINGGRETILKTTDAGDSWSLKYQGNTVYETQYVNHLQFINDSVGFACGENGLLLKSDDKGETWIPVESGTTAGLKKIIFPDSLNGFIYSGTNGLKTCDGGNTWTWDTIFRGLPVNRVDDCIFTNDSTGFVFVYSSQPDYDSYIYKTTDAGNTWTQVYEDPGSAYTGKFAFFNEQQGMIACATWMYQTKILLTDDAGETWNEIAQPWLPWYSTNAFTCSGETSAIAAGNNGMIYHSSNGGQSWEAGYERIFTGAIYKAQFTDPLTGFVLADTGSGGVASISLLTTCDGGSTWANIFQNSWSATLDFHFISNLTGYLFTEQFSDTMSVFKTTDGGETWTICPGSLTFFIDQKDILFYDEATGIVTGDFEVYKTTDGGQNWASIAPENGIFNKIAFRSAEEILITGSYNNQAALFQSIDGGDSWTIRTIDEADFAGEIALPGEETIVVTCGTKIMKSDDNGNNWSQAATGATPIEYKALFFPSLLTGYAMGEGPFSTIEKTTDGGNTWFPLNTNTSSALNAAWFSDDDNGFVFGERGLMIETSTGGVTTANFLVADKNSALFTISPNPVSGGFILRVRPESNPQGIATLTITCLTGSLIRQQIIPDPGQPAYVSTDMLKPGIYLVTIHTKNGTRETHKLVKI